MAYYIVKHKTIIFSPYFNEEIEQGLLVQYSNVIFSDYVLNEDLFECYENNDFNGFEYKYIGSKFNQPVNLHPNGCSKNITAGCCSCCPEKITHITFGYHFNQQVDLPENLTHLTFGYSFVQQVNLPSNLTHLTFGYHFNQQVNLPEKITHLTFGFKFNQKINLSLNVKYLKLNSNNVNIIDYLPNSVEELVLGFNFNLELNNLPSSIKKLFILNADYNYELNCLPNNLEYFQLPERYDKEIKKYPKQLKTIKCHYNYKYIDKLKGFEIKNL